VDIREQVEIILKNKEINDCLEMEDLHMLEGLTFVELALQYNEYLLKNQGSDAEQCLQDIARLILTINKK
jgi:hypothetical protein